MKKFAMTTVVTILAVFFGSFPLLAEDFKRCGDCHARTLEQDRSRMFQHPPFSRHECQACHAVQNADVIATTGQMPGRAAPAGSDRRKVNWLGDSAMAVTDHGFLLPEDQLGEILVVEVHSPAGEISRRELMIPLLAELEPIEDAGRAPAVSDVQVLEVRRGVFLSVTIGWRTDTLTTGQVRYGIGDQDRSADSGRRLGRRHQVVLNQLQADKTYQFSVVSRDLFGRSHDSAPLTFSTAKAVAPPPRLSDTPGADNTDVAGSRFFRQGRNYIVELTLEQPGAVFVGSQGTVRLQPVGNEEEPAAALEDETHAGLSSGLTLAIASCGSCHQNQSTATHPINVLPKPGMVIPPEYPTLPDGRITCATCHATHGSNNQYLSRKPGKRDLCVSCHQDML